MKHSTTKSRKNGKVANHHRKNDVFKNTRSKRHEDYCGFVKSRVAKKTRPRVWYLAVVDPFGPKMVSKVCLFENHEN